MSGIPNNVSGITQLLEEHHLVVFGSTRHARGDFAHRLHDHYSSLDSTLVTELDGSHITDLDSFAHTLADAMDIDAPASCDIDDIIELRRTGPSLPRQLLIWNHTEALLERDVEAFGAIANALLGVAAEHEHITPDVLILQRVVFLGDDKLGAYAEDDTSMLRTWTPEDDGDAGDFWQVASVLPRPPVLAYRLDG